MIVMLVNIFNKNITSNTGGEIERYNGDLQQS